MTVARIERSEIRGRPTGSHAAPRISLRSTRATISRNERRNDTIGLLPRAGAQIPAVDLRRPDRPGRHGAHHRRTVRVRAHPAGLDPHRRARRRQDHDGAHPGAGAQLRIARRLDHRADRQMPVLGIHCEAIMESRHLDVIEMDAASHNSVDDVRQINDAIRYAPVSARYKVYILDEVHMLSRRRLQRAAQDAGRAAAARQVRLRHHRNPQSADHGVVALPALRSAPRRCRAAGEAPAGHRRQGEPSKPSRKRWR